MPKISDALVILGVDKQQLSDTYMTLFGKKLTGQVSQANMKTLQDHFSANPSQSVTAKKTTSQANNKAIKADELSSDSFLSGLGFSHVKEETEEDSREVVKKVAVSSKKKIEIVEETPLVEIQKDDGREAVVIKKSEPIVTKATATIPTQTPEKKFVFK
ncbi:MAG TPA: hypothetical protein PKD96_04635, partial [Candidatus Absconditabacterales bacterium]|nr:hypothetical protein [Candidatus Absconditabacterales bacterium]